MTELLDFLLGLLTPNFIRIDYSDSVRRAVVLEGIERERILDVFREHMNSDPATACIGYDSIFVKTIGKKHVKLVALKDGKKVFKYISRNKFGVCPKKCYLVIC